DDDQDVELRRGDLGPEALHRVLHFVETFRDRLVGDELRDVRGRACEHIGIGARPAFAVVVLHAKVALTKSPEPVLQLGRKHDAVGGTERGGETRHLQSAFAPDCFTTRVHRCRSRAAHAPNSSGGPLWGTRPNAFIFACVSGRSISSFSFELSRATISLGIPAGATIPVPEVEVTAGYPLSARVGMSGRSASRVAPVMARARTSPLFTRVRTRSKSTSACPAITAVSAGAPPAYG